MISKAFLLNTSLLFLVNVASNKAGKTLKNAAELTWTSTAPVHSAGPAHSDPITVIEPEITVQKTVSPKNAEAGDSATFTINVTARVMTIRTTSGLTMFFLLASQRRPGHFVRVANCRVIFKQLLLTRFMPFGTRSRLDRRARCNSM